MLKVKATGAHLPERAGARQLLESVTHELPRLQVIWADQGYRGEEEWVKERLGCKLEIVAGTSPKERHAAVWATARQRQREGATILEMWAGLTTGRGIEVLPRRWVVERTFSWFTKCRRLSKDYEFLPQSSECMIYLTMTRLMLKRLGKTLIK